MTTAAITRGDVGVGADADARRRSADYERHRYRQQRSATWAPFTPAEPVREHLQDLRASGMTLEQISRTGGVSVATLLRAATAPRISTAAADAILCVQPGDANPAAAAATEALRALHADGWTLEQLAAATGLTSHAIGATVNGRTRPHPHTTAAIAGVYEHLRLEDPGDGAAAVRSRLRAERAGWKPSTQQKDVDIIDIVAVDRAVRGEVVPLRPGERQAALQRLAGHHPDAEIARRLGVSGRTVLRHRASQGLPAYAAPRAADTPSR